MTRLSSTLLALSIGAAACAPFQAVIAQATAAPRYVATPSSDSAVYAAFFETLNRDPRRDTLNVEELSKVFVKLPAHYDSTAPGLNAALSKLSRDQRPTTTLHLPPPVKVIPDNVASRLAASDLLGELGAVPDRPQGTSGLWAFTPVVYSADGTDAMFSYAEYCGRRCGEDVVVWTRKNAGGKWEVRRTAILTIE